MTPVLFVGLSLAGGVGAACRLLLDSLIHRRVTATYPVGTTFINVTGSLLLGFLTALASTGLVLEEWRLLLGSGVLGGYTTFSTASFETVQLIQERRPRAAILYGLGTLVVSTTVAGFGLWLGSLL